jgi:tetratricopeptide (TPR) repeat protein
VGSQPVSTPARVKEFSLLHPGRWVAAWTLTAFLLRLANSLAQRRNPFLAYLPVDQGSYDRWASRIAGGEWLGHGIFYQDPLYPYFLGLLYATIGRHLVVVLVVQGLLGALNVPLLWGIATRLWGERAGRIAALLAALYAPFIFYDGLVLKTFLEVLLLNAAVLATLWAADAVDPSREKNSPAGGRPAATVVRRGLLAGLLLGIGSLARANYPLLAPILAAWVLRAGGRPMRTRAGSIGAAAVIAGMLLVLLPVLIRNRAIGHDWVLTTSQAGQNFYIGNCATNQSGAYQAPPFVRPDPQHEEEDFRNEAQRRLGSSLKPSQISRYWAREAWSFIWAHPGRFVARSVTRLGLLLHRYEIPDNEDFRVWAGYSPWLRFNPVRWDMVGPPAIVGLALCWRQRRRAWLLYGLTGVYVFSMAAFFVLGRYRLPATSLLLVFTAGAIDAGWTAWKARDRRRLVIGGVALLLGIVIVHRPNREEKPATSPALYSLLGAAELAAGKVDEALAAQRKAVELGPNSAELRYNLASTLYSAGQLDEAIAEFRRVTAMTPDYAETWSFLGNILVEKGDIEGAVAAQRRALAIQPRLGIHLYNLARVLAHAGRDAEASAVLDTLDAVKDPKYTQEGSIIRATLFANAGRVADAAAIVRDYLRANPVARTRPQLEALLRAWEKGQVGAQPR